MARNAYFQLVQQDGKVYLKVNPPEEGGQMVNTDEVVRYFDNISFPNYDLIVLDAYLKDNNFENPLFLWDGEIIPESERVFVRISEQGDKAYAKFYPPSTGGGLMTEAEIVSDLKLAGIKHGIKRKSIAHFLEHHEYSREYIIAEATLPVQGSDAKIVYYFDVNATAKPKLNEDGSVDFHQLGNIKAVEKGDKLAQLTPAVHGRAGINVYGKPMPAKKVKVRRLKYGRNIILSDNKCNLYSNVSGHVSLVDDMVMVSNIYKVPANVDSSTGDIEYKGTVEVAGNVNTGFKIQAEGDIVVHGVVEGAVLISGGNIVLKRGMQGMDKGELQAKGNVTAKFLENCKVSCEGRLKADAILHSEIRCRENIDVLGKKGLINGGSITTYGTIHATTFGSTMGGITNVTVLSDKDLIIRTNEIKEQISDRKKEIEKIDQLAELVRDLLAKGDEISKEQMEYVKTATVRKPRLTKEIKELNNEREEILTRIERHKKACVIAEDSVFSGVNLSIKDASRNIHEKLSKCRLVRDGADVRILGV